jgi:cysteine desulfurase family protein (TIGR01976 family)
VSFPIEAVREGFPALAITDQGRARVYLDNPAGTQVPESVAKAVYDCLIRSNANLGGFFATSRAADAVIDAAHAAMADFFGTEDPGEVVIGANMTTLTLHISRSIVRDWEPGDEIILTQMDHEGNVAPWLEVAADKGLAVRWAAIDPTTWRVEAEAIRDLIGPRTRLVAINYASNMTGAVNDVRAIADLARAAGALSYVDAVQFAPHRAIDVAALGCDFLVCSAYKFFGPHLGVLWGRRALLEAMHAYKVRCVADALPGKFETGTQAHELIAALTATVDYLAWLGGENGAKGSRRERLVSAFREAAAHEDALARRLIDGLEAIDGVTIIGPGGGGNATPRVPTVSFRHASVAPDPIARALADENIFVWSGHNYAVGIVRQLGIPEAEGVLRIGIAHYNTETEIDAVLGAVDRAIRAEQARSAG